MVWGLHACGQHYNSPTCRGFQYLQNSSKTLSVGPCPRAALVCFSLVLHPFLSLINKCLNLPTGTQGRSWRLKEGCFLYSKKWGTQKVFVPRSPVGTLLSIRTFFFIELSLVTHLKVECFRYFLWITMQLWFSQLCLTVCTLWTEAHQALLSMGFPRLEYWSVLPFPSPGDLPDPGIEPTSPASLLNCRQIFYCWAMGEAQIVSPIWTKYWLCKLVLALWHSLLTWTIS